MLVKVPIENLSFALKVLWLTVDLTMEKLSVPAHMEQHMVV